VRIRWTLRTQRLTSSGAYPPQCEFEAIREAATAACDNLDGVIDGIVAAPGLCAFDPHTVVGQAFTCADNGANGTISSEAATIALAAWTGPRNTDGKFLWYGLNRDAPFSGLVDTTCSSPETCVGQPFPIAASWITQFVQKDPNFDIARMSYRQYDSIFRQSNNQFASIIGTSDPDLTDFREAGGKMITWHGLADELIFPNGTYDYYQRVLDLDSKAADYYRFFPAPGVAHCGGGVGFFPDSSIKSLVDWVENDIAPDTLDGTTLPDANGTVRKAPLCPYPLVAAYKGGDINVASSFQCQSSF
jgi:Tannase and feruloyl esterase